MASSLFQKAHARTDREDRLIAADEPLAGFHRRSGGELPGPIVTPALLQLVRKARARGFRQTGQISAQDDREAVLAWIEVVPESDGCAVTIHHWHADAFPEANPAEVDDQRFALAREVGELSARLDSSQAVLTAEAHGSALAALAERMRQGSGRPWTDFVELESNAHQQPLHWRLLDGARLQIAGSSRLWHATIIPMGRPNAGASGFELYLLSDAPPPAVKKKDSMSGAMSRTGVGLEIAPVLRQPIARIIANAETIRAQLAGPLAEEYSAYAGDIASAGEHLMALVEDLTALEVVESEGFAPEPDLIDLADVARRAAGILQVRARERGITIELPGEGESAPAIGEFRRVLQILLNVVGNAIRYSPAGAKVWLRCEADGEHARITVADHGDGLDPAQQARIFDKFERLGREGDGGSGLGLYISRRLAEAMGGSLTVDSATGQGARFTLHLPVDSDTA